MRVMGNKLSDKILTHIRNIKNYKGKFAQVKKVIFRPVTLVAISIILFGLLIYIYTLYLKSQNTLEKFVEDPAVLAAKETEKVVDKVSELIILPNDEKPTLATVTDADTLRKQVFFKNVKNGDKILIYSQERKVVIYRPSENKLVDVAPVNVDTNETESLQLDNTKGASTQSEQIQLDTIKIAIFNGTQKAGQNDIVYNNIAEKIPEYNFEIVRKAAASKEYANTIVVDITGKYSSVVSNISDMLNGTISEIPDGEETPDADIVIIVGNDF